MNSSNAEKRNGRFLDCNNGQPLSDLYIQKRFKHLNQQTSSDNVYSSRHPTFSVSAENHNGRFLPNTNGKTRQYDGYPAYTETGLPELECDLLSVEESFELMNHITSILDEWKMKNTTPSTEPGTDKLPGIRAERRPCLFVQNPGHFPDLEPPFVENAINIPTSPSSRLQQNCVDFVGSQQCGMLNADTENVKLSTIRLHSNDEASSDATVKATAPKHTANPISWDQDMPIQGKALASPLFQNNSQRATYVSNQKGHTRQDISNPCSTSNTPQPPRTAQKSPRTPVAEGHFFGSGYKDHMATNQYTDHLIAIQQQIASMTPVREDSAVDTLDDDGLFEGCYEKELLLDLFKELTEDLKQANAEQSCFSAHGGLEDINMDDFAALLNRSATDVVCQDIGQNTQNKMESTYLQSAYLVGAGAVTVIGIAAARYYMAHKIQPLVPIVPLENQSRELEDGSRVAAFITNDSPLMEYLYDDVRTLHEAFLRGMRVSKNGNCLGARTGPNKEYQWLSYREVYDKAHAFGSGLINLGLSAGNKTYVAIYSTNRIEWTVAEQAHHMFSLVTVALYASLGSDACRYVIDQTQLSTVICDVPEKIQSLLNVADKLPKLKRIIHIEPASKENIKTAKTRNIQLISFSAVEELGRLKPQQTLLPTAEDLACISYTSGSTGDPKGVLSTHGNIIAGISSVLFHLKGAVDVTPDDVHISYLPLAHVYEHGMQILVFMEGAQIGFFQGSIVLLASDLQALKPTIFSTVPRLLNRTYNKVMATVQGNKVKSMLLRWGVHSKLADLRRGIIRRDTIWDRLMFGKIQEMYGGRVRLVMTGSAPLSVDVLNFIRAAFGCLVSEGYGQTETMGGITFTISGEYESGHCGPPMAWAKVKLTDVPEMDYYAKDGRGEICCKGRCVFQGYFKNEQKTADVFDEDGWMRTGDIGEWLPNGTLRIIDRKKNIFKLSQGEYIAVEKIENIYMRSQFIAQCYIDGNSLQSCVMGIVTLDKEHCLEWAKNNGFPESMERISQSEEFKAAVLRDLHRLGKEGDLKGFEQVKDIHIHPEQFSIENGLLTPSLKNKRHLLKKMFQSRIEELYRQHSA
ncbi:long-chain-fatty-acid--CoA ligase 5-like [Gigantopelta aegis]|uniref:long-chain-fatty-acid--CoA ligase 5-like n=1 Tax=Gigantopelta aegis TaxID=1735272 RepID=UPI001B88BC67|nr:long-chain-fatty-acid--CoA ligase 5-like [Gigantopelta aegis]